MQLSNCLRRTFARLKVLEVRWEELGKIESVDMRHLQKKNALELALLDFRSHLTALQHEASRRLQPVTRC